MFPFTYSELFCSNIKIIMINVWILIIFITIIFYAFFRFYQEFLLAQVNFFVPTTKQNVDLGEGLCFFEKQSSKFGGTSYSKFCWDCTKAPSLKQMRYFCSKNSERAVGRNTFSENCSYTRKSPARGGASFPPKLTFDAEPQFFFMF